jgi:maltooligosyltrehalose trehalohydrolase
MSRASTSSAADAPVGPAARAAPAGRRLLPAGAEVVGEGVLFRVWAPEMKRVSVVIEGRGGGEVLGLDPETAVAPGEGGYWSGVARGLGAGARYRLRLDDGGQGGGGQGGGDLLPDPFSRFQPEGPHGPSEVIDPASYRWQDGGWTGVTLPGQIIYELHVGTFTPEGTWAAARARLPHLAALGVTALQLMPVAEFAGRFGWGYDGVDLFAPYHRYGRPDDLRRFVDEAHGHGLAVILDVVYNHIGPDGNYLERFSRRYFSDRDTEWGRAINYDGPGCHGARTLAIANAAYWIREYHLDGLRLDATQSIWDRSPDHLVSALAREARAAAGERGILLVAENEPQSSRLVRPQAEGGHGLDAIYNEDLHHTAVVAATGRREGYYSEYNGTAQELLSAVKHGFLFQGQRYHWQKQRRGEPTRGLLPWHGAAFLENHDQVANSARGLRLWQLTSPGRHRALTTLLLLGPWTPLLFQGAEWSSSRPFFYFADHTPELAALVKQGRGEFLAQFPSCASPASQAALADPGDQRTFAAAALDWQELARAPHDEALALHRDLIRLRKRDPVIAAQGRGGVTIDGAVLGPECLLLRWFVDGGAPGAGTDAGGGAPADDRLLLVNLGPELRLRPAPEPLLAPPPGGRWRLLLSSDDRRYGGPGAVAPESEEEGWVVAAHAACLLQGEAAAAPDDDNKDDNDDGRGGDHGQH